MNRFFFIIFSILFINCNKSSVDNIKVVIPIAPTNLNGSVLSDTKISISWTDNSTNEDGFKIERKTTSTSYVQIATIPKDITLFTDSSLSLNTQYIYRVYSYNSAGFSATYSNELILRTKSVPQIITNLISSISYSSALGGGTISSDGQSPIIARGVIWDTLPSPTFNLKTKTSDSVGVGIGNFQSIIVGLMPSTKYYLRAYARNNIGVAYGNEISFITTQPTQVNIGTQKWMKENLDVMTYRNGDIIPQVTDPNAWAGLTSGAWCYSSNDPADGAIYGKLYNWYAVNDPRGLAPVGWHIPTDAEWSTLGNYLGVNAGGKLKANGTNLWKYPNTGQADCGFSGLPGGSRDLNGVFSDVGFGGNWWSTTQASSTGAWYRNLFYSSGDLTRYSFNNLRWGFSVRCIKD
jgi:uncharacterized protein (TIGR02145 family)